MEVFEADMEAGAWKPLVGRLGGGQVLFIGNSIVKFVPACGEIEVDAIFSCTWSKYLGFPLDRSVQLNRCVCWRVPTCLWNGDPLV